MAMRKPSKPKPKARVMALRLKEKDELMLDELAKGYNAPKAVILRMLIRDAHNKLRNAPPQMLPREAVEDDEPDD